MEALLGWSRPFCPQKGLTAGAQPCSSSPPRVVLPPPSCCFSLPLSSCLRTGLGRNVCFLHKSSLCCIPHPGGGIGFLRGLPHRMARTSAPHAQHLRGPSFPPEPLRCWGWSRGEPWQTPRAGAATFPRYLVIYCWPGADAGHSSHPCGMGAAPVGSPLGVRVGAPGPPAWSAEGRRGQDTPPAWWALIPGGHRTGGAQQERWRPLLVPRWAPMMKASGSFRYLLSPGFSLACLNNLTKNSASRINTG